MYGSGEVKKLNNPPHKKTPTNTTQTGSNTQRREGEKSQEESKTKGGKFYAIRLPKFIQMDANLCHFVFGYVVQMEDREGGDRERKRRKRKGGGQAGEDKGEGRNGKGGRELGRKGDMKKWKTYVCFEVKKIKVK